jgi:hypothetical protein
LDVAKHYYHKVRKYRFNYTLIILLVAFDKLDMHYFSKFKKTERFSEKKIINQIILLLTKDQYNLDDIDEDMVIDVMFDFVQIDPNKYYIYFLHHF